MNFLHHDTLHYFSPSFITLIPLIFFVLKMSSAFYLTSHRSTDTIAILFYLFIQYLKRCTLLAEIAILPGGPL